MEMTLTKEASMDHKLDNEAPAKAVAKITIKSGSFRKALNRVAAVVDPKNSKPILTGIYLHANAERLQIRAQNDIFSSQVDLPPSEYVLEDGEQALVIPAIKFKQTIEKITGANVVLEFEGNQITVKSKGVKVKMTGQGASMYPAPPKVKAESRFDIPSEVLISMYDATIYAVSVKDDTPILGGVCHDIRNNRFRCIATDRHRLSQMYYGAEIKAEDIRTTIPAGSIKKLMDHLKAASSIVTVSLSSDRVIFDMGDSIFCTNVLSGVFPDTDRIIPQQFLTQATFNVYELKEAFDLSSIFEDENGKFKATLIIDPDQNQVRILSSNNQLGRGQNDMIPITSEGNFISVTCSVKYLTDLFNKLPKENRVVLSFTGPTSPFMIRDTEASEGNVFIMVPVKDDDNKIDSIENFEPPAQEEDPFASRADSYASDAANEE